jgi:anti-anti-sigma factor
MEITQKQDAGQTTLLVEGRIDTNTSPALQEAITAAFKTVQSVTVDFTGVSYISSAGLRALLIGQKTASSKHGEFALTNVNEMVKSILDTVGFSKILTIK